MSRPTLVPINSSITGWVARINDNFEKCIDKPFPIALFVDVGTLTSSANPKLFKDCLALVGASGSARLYSSDGTVWTEYLEQLSFVSDLVPGSATIADIKNAHNGILADMQTKGYMA